MKRKSSVSFGPGAASLILIFVMLSMSVLGMLSLMTARNDAKMSERSLEVIEAGYRLMEAAEERFAALDKLAAETRVDAASREDWLAAIEAALPEDVTLDGDQLMWTEADAARMLDCAVQVGSMDGENRLIWVRHNLTAETEDEWN